MKLYSRTGDDGTTGLFGGDRVGKDDVRVEAYGTVDELNACIGVATATGGDHDEVVGRMLAMLTQLTSRLFDLGADLATPVGSAHEDKITRIAASDAAELEGWIDEVEAGNAPLKNFILPGGTELASRLHLARAVCRRAERRLVSLARVHEINPETVIFLNRIGDLLFAMARRANNAAGVADVPWKG